MSFRTRTSTLVAIALAGLLSSCGGDEERAAPVLEVDAGAAKGGVATSSIGSMRMPEWMPASVSLPPGSQIRVANESTNGSAFMIVATDDNVKQVVNYFSTSLTENGWTIEASYENQAQVEYLNGGTKLTVTVTMGRDGEASSITTITFSPE